MSINVLVCVKRVPLTGGKIVLTDDERAIQTRHLGFTVSPHEECGAEEAVRLVEKHGGTSTVLTLGPPEIHYAPPPLRDLSDKQLFEKQTEILREIAKKNDCVIVGWGGCHVLPRHRRKLNVFCHAPLGFRAGRVMEMYGVQTEEQARATIAESDEMRKEYIMEMTGKDWVCAENYHLALDTSLLTFEESAELVINFFKRKDEKG